MLGNYTTPKTVYDDRNQHVQRPHYKTLGEHFPNSITNWLNPLGFLCETIKTKGKLASSFFRGTLWSLLWTHTSNVKCKVQPKHAVQSVLFWWCDCDLFTLESSKTNAVQFKQKTNPLLHFNFAQVLHIDYNTFFRIHTKTPIKGM